ncbi:secretin N-terminal domain-containing protein [Deinococcus humi]|uniref:Type II secretory pathway component GspD/PulD (Secretin) n=1 Tax=Deinococcus humi TaxID=662880 RepID=A0A7W8NIN9_9DEIO|nr:secretin N-terminal domain-containing protein [Deinococcus humi]MBB5366043.1 type II secretory pathway component GspD/PulD (secretin) [Deinococcus humi]GGO39918.1 putative type IV piliation system protein [Deinococcus humi]
MMNRYALLLTAALGMAAAQTAPAQTVPATPSNATPKPAISASPAQTIVSDPQLSVAKVTFEVRRAGSDLASMLVALAMSAGYEIIIEPSVDGVLLANSVAAPTGAAATGMGNVVSYSFKDKPFNEVWPLVLDIYGLSYESLGIGGKTVLRVGIKPIQKIVKLPASLSAADTERQLKLSFGSLRKITSSQTNAAPAGANVAGAQATTTEASQEEIVLDSPTMRIVAEPASNSVIIRGTNQEVAQVERLLSQIIAAQASAPAVVKPTPIPNVQRVYSVNGRQEDVVGLLGAQYPGLKVSAMGTTGQVVVSGPEDQLGEAFKLLAQVDRPVSVALDPKTSVQVYSAKGKSEDVTKFLAAQYPGLKVTPIGTTERLVISGAQDQLSAALALLGQVDQPAPVAASTVQRVFTLINASAEEVKATLEGTLARDVTPNTLTPNATLINPITGQPYTSGPVANAPLQSQAAGTAGTDSAATTQAATIIADKRTNTVIVRGTVAQVEQVAQLIPQLDQKVPQINVQVRIQEITESAGRSLGIDWKVGFGGFTVSAGGGGLGAAFNPTQSLMGFNLGATLNTLQNQGLSKSVYDGAITMQSGQRSLGSAGQTQNASADAAATIKSGGRLEINIPSAAANVPGIQKQIDYGVNLDFYNPQVAPDGSITMRVRGQVNDLTTAITASTVPNLLQFTNSEAQTTLTFKSGETLLLSGLLKTRETRNNDGVPFLSSIPVIGGLFGKETTKKEQTQLLVVITGNIVK